MNSDVAGVNNDLTAPKNIASTESKLLTSLAQIYPNGKLPANRLSQSSKDLAQNPAAHKITAQSFSVNSANPTYLANAIQPQAAAADFQPVQRIQNASLYGAYFFSFYPSEVTSALAGNPNWTLEGPAFWASLATGSGLSPVHRFQNKINGSYLYTIYDTERADIVANFSATFTYEGVAWYARQTPASGWSALYRFRNKTNGTYLFSAYESEKDAIVATYPEVFELEGIAYYVRQDAPLELRLLAGSGSFDSANGAGAAASFKYVLGMVHDSSGNLFVTDRDNHTIRKITPEGVVSTYAGAAGTAGSTNGTALTARFSRPWGITIDSSGNLFVVENRNHTIRKITPAGVVSLFAGGTGITGATDATGSAARFNSP